MDRMLVVVFDNESKAYEGKEGAPAIGQRRQHQRLRLRSSCKERRWHCIGKARRRPGASRDSGRDFAWKPDRSVVWASWRSDRRNRGICCRLGRRHDNARIGDDFIADVSKQLLPNRVAVVAEIEEDWTTPVDTRMEAIGGTVFRRALSEARKTSNEEEVAAMKADMAQMKAEHAKAHAEHKAKLQEKINQLDSKIQAQLQKAKEKRAAAEEEAQAKVQILKAKAEHAAAKASQRQENAGAQQPIDARL